MRTTNDFISVLSPKIKKGKALYFLQLCHLKEATASRSNYPEQQNDHISVLRPKYVQGPLVSEDLLPIFKK